MEITQEIVEKKKTINELSLIPGGSDLILTYEKGKPVDKEQPKQIKFIPSYVRALPKKDKKMGKLLSVVCKKCGKYYYGSPEMIQKNSEPKANSIF